MFPAYVENPQNCSFEGQDPDEKVLLLLRAHPITNIPWILFAFILFFVPFFTPQVMAFFRINLSLIPPGYIAISLIFNYLLVLVVTFEGFLYWYFNVTLVTDLKVLDIDFEPFLYKGVDLAPLDKIEEVDSTIKGLFGTIFNFGDVSVQTAGAKVAIEIKNVPKSAQVADLILDLSRKAKGG